MLVLPIKKRWYDMILSGEKKEEYREIKPYYTTRLKNCHLLSQNDLPSVWSEKVIFRNGYSKEAPSFIADVKLSIGTGKPEWGAEVGKEYYILTIIKVSRTTSSREDGPTAFLARTLISMKAHPGMYFEEKSYNALRAFVFGFASGIQYMGSAKGEPYQPFYREDMWELFGKRVKDLNMTDSEKYDYYLDVFEDMLKSRYPKFYANL